MLRAIQIAAIVLTALAMAPALAHAFEFPGKRRLDKGSYLAVQGMYFPGFTLLGIAEPAALIVMVIVLFVTPRYSTAFVLAALALVCVLAMQLVYWIFTHPTNRYWLESAKVTLGKAGEGFFAGGSAAEAADWTKIRDRWEYSHIARAVLSFLSFVLMTLAAVRFS